MPTSSQALILQSSYGRLPPVFGRRHWFPGTSMLHPISSFDFNQRSFPVKGRDPRLPSYTLRRTESAPSLALDWATLPSILTVNKIDARLAMNETYTPSTFKFPSIPNIAPTRILKEVWTTKSQNNRQKRHDNYTIQLSGSRETCPKRVVGEEEAEELNHELVTRDKVPYELAEYSSNEPFFKLIKVDNVHFHLVRTFNREVGSFRLSKTDPHDIGDYKVIPDRSFSIDDFRLVSSDSDSGLFNLYRADPQRPGSFCLVEPMSSSETRVFVQEPPHGMATVTVPREMATDPSSAEITSSISRDIALAEQNAARLGHFGAMQQKIKAPCDARSEVLKETYPMASAMGGMEGLPHATLYGNSKHSILKQQVQQTGPNTPDMSSLDNDMESFRAKYVEGYRGVTMDTSQRLVSQGVRRLSDGTDVTSDLHEEFAIAGGRKGTSSSEWRSSQFDPWSRTARMSREKRTADRTPGVLVDQLLAERSGQDESRDEEEEEETPASFPAAMPEEDRVKWNYRKWKRMKTTVARLRKDLPSPEPNAVCVTLRDNAISHKVMKEMVESVTGSRLTSLQFDPVAVHSPENYARSQWILRFSEPGVCAGLVADGILLKGDRLPVRALDDVMKAEHDAYRLHMAMLQQTQHKTDKQTHSTTRTKAAAKTMKHSHTQTTSH